MPTTLTADLLVDLWQPNSVDLSPDGATVAWSAAPLGRPEAHGLAAVFLAPVDGSRPPRQWTHGGDDRAPAFSPDGANLAFLSDRARRGVAGLYVAPVAGGEAAPLVVGPVGVEDFRWSPDGTEIAYLQADKDDSEESDKADDAEVRGDSWPYARLKIVTVGTGEVRTVLDGDRHVQELTWSPDGSRLGCLCTPTPELDSLARAEIVVVGSSGGESRRVCGAPWSGGLSFSTDGAVLVFTGQHGGASVAAVSVWSVDPDAGDPVLIGPSAGDPFCVTALAIVPGERRVLIAIADGLDSRLELRDPVTGEARTVYDSPGDLRAVAGAQTPAGLILAYVEGTRERVFEVCAGPADRPAMISRHGASVVDVSWGTVEDFCWRSDGLDLDGILIRPPQAGPDPLPTVVLPHGGPYGRSGRTLHAGTLDWGQWLATAGYAVLLPNYRGGLGHGERFAAMARGGVGGGEFDDVMSAVDAVVERGIADPERLAIAGWSQGGFLTAWAVTQTDRFAAAVMGAGVSDWRGMVLEGDLPTMEAGLVESLPWDGPGPHSADARSPISFAAAARTPVLILHGANDARVPHPQGTGFERALRDGPSPVRLVSYPREPHAIREAAHLRQLLGEVRQWLAQWLAAPPAPARVRETPREVLSWSDFGRASRELAEQVAASGYQPDLILSIARGGLFAAGALGYALDVKNLHVMNVEFYTGVGKRLDMPVMLPPVPSVVDLAGARVLVADDVADTGATLKLVRDFCIDHVAEVRCAVIYEKPESEVRCEYVWRRTDRWINFPWSESPPVVDRPDAVHDA
jgi:dipeptidyl aminopeptidase/acylaminoacyl peptidase/hypoxanthine phosphoribosyltransferase